MSFRVKLFKDDNALKFIQWIIGVESTVTISMGTNFEL